MGREDEWEREKEASGRGERGKGRESKMGKRGEKTNKCDNCLTISHVLTFTFVLLINGLIFRTLGLI